METLHTIRKWLDKIVGTICIFLFALMVVVGSYQIITRFIFNNPSTISEELLTYSFAWMAMFATAYVFGKRDHMRMTFVVDKLAPAQRKVLEIVLEVLVIAFAAIVLIYDSEDSFPWSYDGTGICSRSDFRNPDCDLWNFKCS